MRYLVIAGPVLIAVFLLKSKPGHWLPLLPLLFMAGGLTLHMGVFEPAVATLVIIMFTFFYIADRILRNKTLFVPSPYLFFIFIAILIQVVSIFISIHVHEQYQWNAIRDGSSLFLFFPLAVIIPAICRTEKKFNQLLRAILVTLLVASTIGVIQYISITSFSRVDLGLGYVYRGRIASLFGNANIFAGYLELGIPIAIALLVTEKDIKWRITAAVAIVLGILSVLYTFSRGGLLGVFLGCGITLVYIFRSKVWIPILIGILAVVLLVMSVGTFERQMTFFMDPSAHLTQPTILHRYITYRGFINQFTASPVTGVGWGAREFYWGRSMLYSFWEVRHCVSREKIVTFGGLNSLFLNHAVKGGIVSLLSVLLVFATIYKAFFRALKRGGGVLAVAMFAGIFSFMIHQIIGNQLRFPTVNSQFWIVTGLLLVLASSDLIKQNGEEPLNRLQLPESTKQEDSREKGKNVPHP
ncbi:hypothetical protein DRQ25_02745 [Candidatus Fermentibacteria bacterium]|nr:MAG: hypothetical protein DRQ25_02745 [Candidatus Fermentibacteria bacterium]